jgi:hypothetical protein
MIRVTHASKKCKSSWSTGIGKCIRGKVSAGNPLNTRRERPIIFDEFLDRLPGGIERDEQSDWHEITIMCPHPFPQSPSTPSALNPQQLFSNQM